MTVLDYRSGIDERARGRFGAFNWLGWAIYLGMSWTWCIGMFLPVLLIRDYGPWSWWVFAIPNVFGAAAMGRVLDDQSSRKLASQHRTAIAAFSFVTATFQIFFAFWISSFASAANGAPWGWIIVILSAAWCVGPRTSTRAMIGAIAALVMSLGTFAFDFKALSFPSIESYDRVPDGLIGLAPVCVFGFGLCPYLDRTFHKARQHTSGLEGRLAFGVGFGLIFLLMIIYTLGYAPVVLQMENSRTWMVLGVVGLGAHWMVQLVFTTGLHWRAIPSRYAVVSALIGIATGYSTFFLRLSSMNSGEFIYRLFMAFYGLVFPAYVWLCMIPTWREPAKPSRRSLAVFAGSIFLATPFYWMGFIEQRMFWLLPGLAIVLLARLLVPGTGQRAVPPSPVTA